MYVSNLQSDIDKSSNGTLNRTNNIFVNFMEAIDRARELVAPYTTKSNGGILTVYILFYKGDHYILNKNTTNSSLVIDTYNSTYEIRIMPYY